MSEFWLGVFAGLAVWFFLNLLLALAQYGKQTTIELETVAAHFAFMVIAMFAAWWVEVGL